METSFEGMHAHVSMYLLHSAATCHTDLRIPLLSSSPSLRLLSFPSAGNSLVCLAAFRHALARLVIAYSSNSTAGIGSVHR